MSTVDGVEITGPMGERYDEVLTPRALELIARLHREFNGRRLERLRARQERVDALAAGGTLDFLPETAGGRRLGSRVRAKCALKCRRTSGASTMRTPRTSSRRRHTASTISIT